jgi:hypothetical protein
MANYSGKATLDDGERRETVNVELRGTQLTLRARAFDGDAILQRHDEWRGRITSSFDGGRWHGKLVSLRLPTGRSGDVIVEARGALTGSGDPPFDF